MHYTESDLCLVFLFSRTPWFCIFYFITNKTISILIHLLLQEEVFSQNNKFLKDIFRRCLGFWVTNSIKNRLNCSYLVQHPRPIKRTFKTTLRAIGSCNYISKNLGKLKKISIYIPLIQRTPKYYFKVPFVKRQVSGKEIISKIKSKYSSVR